ncbi:MAG TPA: nucleotide exchange factor GrpE [Candidatus Sulfotelmatobacter sp.]|nr:nucleotide exchange factor GrpE [Candidatus Sulfotelmatobacter sp.]
MGKSNGKREAEGLDLEHELPPADGDEPSSNAAQGAATSTEATGAEAELQKVKAERDMYVDRLARMQAEFDNARKRAIKEQQDFRDFASVDVIKSLLPIVDNFERALQSKSEPADFRSGVELIYKQLQDALTKLGVQPIVSKGKPFDPHVHEAIEMVETPDAADHEVLEEWQRGYKFKDRLLRPAMVKVAKNPGK